MRIAIVGPCGAGKTTLEANLTRLGYEARAVVQEHSEVPTMWQRVTRPDVVIYLDASLATINARRGVNWEQSYLDEMNRRLAHARAHAHFYLDTDDLTIEEVCARVVEFLETKACPERSEGTNDGGRMTKDEGQNTTELALRVLTRQPFDESAIQEAIALLREHTVARDDTNQIDSAHIARVCARDWSLFHTIYDNLLTLEKSLDKYLERKEARRVWQRIELIQGEMDRAPKSLGWMIKQVLHKPTEVPR
jgi:broad-specificity NMP kinase